MKKNPYISVVVTTRNDNYGENMEQRLRMFVNSLEMYQQKYSDLFELIIVEWNPPDNNLPIHSIIPECSALPIRVITVPSDIHAIFNVKAPIVEYCAKNVGIRRSSGEYVLVTNPDILFSEELVKLLSERILEPNVLYRSDRFDFKGNNVKVDDVNSYLDYAIENTFQCHLSDDNCYFIPSGTKFSDFPTSDSSRLHTNGSGDFILSHRSTYDAINGLYEELDFSNHADSVSVIRFFYNNIPQSILSAPACIFHQDHARGNREAWNPHKAHAIGNSVGKENWGLKQHNLKEWRNLD